MEPGVVYECTECGIEVTDFTTDRVPQVQLCLDCRIIVNLNPQDKQTYKEFLDEKQPRRRK